MEPKKSRDPLYITIIVLLLGTAGYFAYLWSDVKSANKTLTDENAKLEADAKYMKDLMEKNGMVDVMGEDLKDNLEFMLDSYSQLKTTNSAMNDSISIQKERIAKLLDEAKKHKGDAYAILRLKKEAETLRNIMKSYIHTIDSLNTVNQGLVVDIHNKEKVISDVSAERDQLNEKSKNLEDKVAKGSVLQTSGLSAIGLRIRNSGKQVETSKAGRVDMIKACMSIMENRIAKPGPREVYMVVITPDGNIISDNPSVSVNTEEGATPFSLKRAIDYQNATLDLCMYAEIKEGIELKGGTYIVKIYCDRALIGKSTFTLK
jgi:hypothetical protein